MGSGKRSGAYELYLTRSIITYHTIKWIILWGLLWLHIRRCYSSTPMRKLMQCLHIHTYREDGNTWERSVSSKRAQIKSPYRKEPMNHLKTQFTLNIISTFFLRLKLEAILVEPGLGHWWTCDAKREDIQDWRLSTCAMKRLPKRQFNICPATCKEHL